jgi:hypothetical protein
MEEKNVKKIRQRQGCGKTKRKAERKGRGNETDRLKKGTGEKKGIGERRGDKKGNERKERGR